MEVKSIKARIEASGLGDLVRRVFETLPSAVIAGGFVRDIMNDRPVKDVDVLLEGPDELTPDEIDLLDVELTHDDDYGESRSDTPGQLKRVYEDTDNRLDILVVRSIEETVAGFPDDISQAFIAFTGGDYVLTTTPAYDRAHENKTITLLKPLTTGDRLLRLKDKYPDYAVVRGYVIPEPTPVLY